MAILDIAAGPASVQALPGAGPAAAAAQRSGNGAEIGATFNAFNMDLEAALNLDRCTLTLVHDYAADVDLDAEGAADKGVGSDAGGEDSSAANGSSSPDVGTAVSLTLFIYRYILCEYC